MENTQKNTTPEQRQRIRKFFGTYIAIIALIVVFLFGYGLGRNDINMVVTGENNNPKSGTVNNKNSTPPAWYSNDVEFQIFWDVWNTIQNEYVDRPAPETEMFYGAIQGMIMSLDDPFSVFLKPVFAENFTETLSGKFEGIGAEIGIRDNVLTIISPLPESPAEKAGLKAQDKVIKIDGFDTVEISIDDAVNRIRGEKGTEVVLTVYREGETDLMDIPIIRDTIKIVSVTDEIKQTKSGKSVGYVKITNFNADTGTRITTAINELLSQGAESFIVDVRSNPGGFLNVASEITELWVESGKTIVQERFSGGRTELNLSKGSGRLAEFPTIVLINGGSASASEIFAGALKDYGLAVLVGEKSFGKGSVQSLTNFSDGSSLKLTIARWLTPLGHQIDGEGIKPDYEVGRSIEQFESGEDPQLEKALELLDMDFDDIKKGDAK